MNNHVIMFQPRFARLVESGAKLTTIRGESHNPKYPPEVILYKGRPIAPGDTLDLREWPGRPYATKHRKIRMEICESVERIILDRDEFDSMEIGGVFQDQTPREAVARGDGFADFLTMMEWFDKTHGLPFRGVLIRWKLL